jgi:Mn-dependent DtxR family transcriptional regulator
MKDLVNLTGNSLSDLIDVIGKLEGAGLVERTRDGNLSLTDKGRGDAMAVE